MNTNIKVIIVGMLIGAIVGGTLEAFGLPLFVTRIGTIGTAYLYMYLNDKIIDC